MARRLDKDGYYLDSNNHSWRCEVDCEVDEGLEHHNVCKNITLDKFYDDPDDYFPLEMNKEEEHQYWINYNKMN